MHVEFLLEERSAEAALARLLPKLLPPESTWSLHPFQGKPDLLAKFPSRLQGYARGWLPDDHRIVVLVDADQDDCRRLKSRLEAAASAVGLRTRSATGPGGQFVVLNRIAVEELEAWFIGDVEALASAYPAVPRGLGRRRGLRDPDAIRGGAREALERVLQEAGHFRSGLRRIEAAGHIAAHMEPSRNRSRSFRCFVDSLASL
ncbi:MAG: DUF4276 family protein [Planctomycetes bacterium]|jgi:hypothetical protein|nr:DUF4276 family protein [Planctomycetota bacterium]